MNIKGILLIILLLLVGCNDTTKLYEESTVQLDDTRYISTKIYGGMATETDFTVIGNDTTYTAYKVQCNDNALTTVMSWNKNGENTLCLFYGTYLPYNPVFFSVPQDRREYMDSIIKSPCISYSQAMYLLGVYEITNELYAK